MKARIRSPIISRTSEGTVDSYGVYRPQFVYDEDDKKMPACGRKAREEDGCRWVFFTELLGME